MPMLASGVSDPDFYQRKIAQMTQGLSSLAAGFRARKAERDAQAEQEIANFTSAVSTLPELANTWGVELQKKYGKSHPGVEPLVDALRSRRAIESQVESAGKKFYSTWDNLASEHDRKRAEIEALPDLVVTGLGPIPNFRKKQMMDEFGQIDPTRLANSAAAALSPSELAAARLWAKNTYNQELPEEEQINWFEVLPKDQAALLALDQKKIKDESGEIRNSLRYKLGLDQSPKRLQEQEFQSTQAESSQEAALRKVEESDRRAREREATQHQHSLERIGANTSGQRGLIAYREGFKGAGSSPKAKDGFTHKDLLRDNSAQISDWQAGLAAAGAQETNTTRAAKARAEYAKANPRPVRLTDSEARAIARIARDSAGEPVDTVSQAITVYQAAKRAGKSGSEALGAVKRTLGVTTAGASPSPRLLGTGQAGAAATRLSVKGEPGLDPASEISSRVEQYSASLTPDQKSKAIAKLQDKYRGLIASGLSPQDALSKVFE